MKQYYQKTKPIKDGIESITTIEIRRRGIGLVNSMKDPKIGATFQLISWRQIGRLQVTKIRAASVIEVGWRTKRGNRESDRRGGRTAPPAIAAANSRARLRYNDWKLPFRVIAWRLSIWRKFHGLPWKSLNLFRNCGNPSVRDSPFPFSPIVRKNRSVIYRGPREERFAGREMFRPIRGSRVSLPLTSIVRGIVRRAGLGGMVAGDGWLFLFWEKIWQKEKETFITRFAWTSCW